MYNNPRHALADINKVCEPGDRISISAESTGLIMMACDENKPIQPIGQTVLCSLAGIREQRGISK
jgi:hypothetical protein